MSEFTAEEHRKYFYEFCSEVSHAGGATPHLSMVVEASRGLSMREKLWRGGCYCLMYNYAAAELVWLTWQPEELTLEIFEEWSTENWKALPLRKERKAVLSPKKLSECLMSYISWMDKVDKYDWFSGNSGSPERYEQAWEDFNREVKYMGRYIAIRYLEFVNRSLDLNLIMPDIRPKDGKYPRQSIALMYPEYAKELSGGNHKEELTISNLAASQCLVDLWRNYSYKIDYYTLQSLSCEYKQSVLGKRQYPGRSLDSELKYYDRVSKEYPGYGEISKMFNVRKSIFPEFVLGEINDKWSGVRDDLGQVLDSYHYTWSDYKFDYIKSRNDLSKPAERTL